MIITITPRTLKHAETRAKKMLKIIEEVRALNKQGFEVMRFETLNTPEEAEKRLEKLLKEYPKNKKLKTAEIKRLSSIKKKGKGYVLVFKRK